MGAHAKACTFPEGLSSLINRLAGGRLFPGEHNAARFAVEESENHIHFRMESLDQSVKVDVSGACSSRFHARPMLPIDRGGVQVLRVRFARLFGNVESKRGWTGLSCERKSGR